jgi:O-antigen/teichoic acid export membrane protein
VTAADSPAATVAFGDPARGVRWSWISLAVSRLSILVAVPLLLSGLGTDLYAAWALAGTLIGAQSLMDLGIAAALTRFAAVGTAEGSRRVVATVFRRAGIFYLLLSLAIGAPLVLLAAPVADAIPFLDGARERDAGADLLVYAGVAFGVSNIVLVLDALLRGLNRVPDSYRAQTGGWLLFVPTVAVGLALDGGVHAAGVAWLVTYSVQAVILSCVAVPSLRRLPETGALPPTIRSMVALGGKWQISNWADFVTMQLPRLLGGLILGSGVLVTLDLALRFAQLAVAPVLAASAVVLPTATTVWRRHGDAALSEVLDRWYQPLIAGLAVGTGILAPLALPFISTWTGLKLDASAGITAAVVLVGMVALASTGILSSGLLAVGSIADVIRYKVQQLVLGLALVGLGASLGALAVGVGLCIALAMPALLFHSRATRRLGLGKPTRQLYFRHSLVLAAACVGVNTVCVIAGLAVVSAWVVLLMVVPIVTVETILAIRFCGLPRLTWPRVTTALSDRQASDR